VFANPLDKQQAVAAADGLDAVVSFSPEGVAYAAGFMIPSQYIPIRKRVFGTIVTPDRAAMVVAPVEVRQCRASARIGDIRAYNEFTDDPMALVADVLREFGVARGRIAVEIDFLPGRHWTNLQRHLSSAVLVDAEELLSRMRAVKTLEEIDHLRTVARAVHYAHESLYRVARPGWTEHQMGLHLTEDIVTHGGDGISLLVIGSGERSVFANCPPTDRVLRDGDVIRVDVYAHRHRYLSDIARTSVVGHPVPRQADLWQKLCDAETALAEWIRPGANTKEVMARFLALFEQMGLTSEIDFVGHSIGLTLHEEPFFNLHSDFEVEEGMVFAIEPVHYTGTWGFHLEDEVLVTASGCEFLSDGRGPLPVIQNV
jgi:Xaa-Pro dipeptidase